MPDRTLTATNTDGTKETRTFPAASLAARMEPGRAQWLADHSLLLPDGSIQPGVYTAEHLAPLITRPDEDWKIEKLLAVGQSKAWVRGLLSRAFVRAQEIATSTGVTIADIQAGAARWEGLVEGWPYGQALQPIPQAWHPEVVTTPATGGSLAILTEARVREIVRDELNKQSKEKW